MRASNPFRNSMKDGKYSPSCTCVMKLWFGQKYYFIWKAKALHQSVNSAAIDIDQRLRLGQRPNDIWDKVIKYIKRSRVTQFEVEVVFASNNPQEILLKEYRLLQEAKNDPCCLNVSYEPLTPKWITEIDKQAYLELRDGLHVGQVIMAPRGAGSFRVKSLKPQNAEPTTT